MTEFFLGEALLDLILGQNTHRNTRIFAWLVIIGLGVISYTLDTAPPSIAVAPGQEFRTWNQYRISALESRELWLELLKLEDI
jgi:hypothetical protein